MRECAYAVCVGARRRAIVLSWAAVVPWAACAGSTQGDASRTRATPPPGVAGIVAELHVKTAALIDALAAADEATSVGRSADLLDAVTRAESALSDARAIAPRLAERSGRAHLGLGYARAALAHDRAGMRSGDVRQLERAQDLLQLAMETLPRR